MPWIYLLFASILEVGWIISLKETHGFTRIIPIIFYALFGGSSAYFFSLALKSIPIATAYSIWMGIAILGTSLAGIFYFKEQFEFTKFIFILLIIIGIAGLKFTSINNNF